MVETILRKKSIFSLFLVFILAFSVSAIHANDANMTNTSTLNSIDEDAMQIDDVLQEESIVLNGSSDDVSLSETIKNKTEFTSPTVSVYYKGSFNVTLKDSNNTLADKTVAFTINKINYTAVTYENGVSALINILMRRPACSGTNIRILAQRIQPLRITFPPPAQI